MVVVLLVATDETVEPVLADELVDAKELVADMLVDGGDELVTLVGPEVLDPTELVVLVGVVLLVEDEEALLAAVEADEVEAGAGVVVVVLELVEDPVAEGAGVELVDEEEDIRVPPFVTSDAVLPVVDC